MFADTPYVAEDEAIIDTDTACTVHIRGSDRFDTYEENTQNEPPTHLPGPTGCEKTPRRRWRMNSEECLYSGD